jgi:alkanesulfonate monooxygenase SsuD/methylene tetrahydromethanopterin reductase-like flavin-dependent oxidoreductase (luciferase family)
MSAAGSAFAAKHAECVFVGGPNPAFVLRNIVNTREIAASNGRDPYDIKFFVQFTPILGETDEDAQAKFERYKKYAIPDGGLALFGGIFGIDISKFPWDEEFPTDPEHPFMKQFTSLQQQRILRRPRGYDKWTPRILSEYQTIGGSGLFTVGSASTVADEMERWITEGDIDGFNIGHVVVPDAWEDVVKYLTPELERRGWLGNGDYAVPGGTARENLYNTPGNAKLRENHPGYKYKWTERAAD